MNPDVAGMKILVINWLDRSNPQAGGAEIHIHEIFGRLAQWGADVTLLCCRERGAPREDAADGMRIRRVGHRNTFNYHVPWAYRRHFAGRVDVVVDCMNKLPLFMPLVTREPVLTIVHHLFGATAVNEVTSAAAAYVGFFESFVPRIYRGLPIEVISESTRGDLLERGVSEDQIHTVFCGIDHDLYRPSDDPGEGRAARPTLVFLGRIKRYKAVDTLIRALPLIRERVPDARVVIAGDGDDRPRLQGLAGALGFGSDDVEFAGFVDEETKARLYRSAHAAVMPSPKEGWGLTVIEASACGTPVIASDSPGLRESVADGRTGLLYPFGDEAALADRAVKLLTDEELRESMGRQGIEWARRFDWDAAARETLHLLQEQVGGRSHAYRR